MADDTAVPDDENDAPVSEAERQQSQTPDVPPEVKRALRQANKEAETLRLRLKEFEDRDKTEAQKLGERAEAAERSAAQAQRELIRLRVISETGLPANMHKFVVGDDEAAIRANAEELKAELGPDRRSVDIGLGPRQTGAPVNDMNALIRKQAAARRGA